MSDPFVSPSFFRFPQVLSEETLRLTQDSDIILLGATSEVWLKFLSLLWLNSFNLGKDAFNLLMYSNGARQKLFCCNGFCDL